MTQYGTPDILRREDGSIDIDFYIAKAHCARCDAADGRLCAVTRCVVRTARTVALRITARWRPAS